MESYGITTSKYDLPTNPLDDVITTSVKTDNGTTTISIPKSQLLFDVNPHYYSNGILRSITMKLKPGLQNFYDQVGFKVHNQKVAYIYPLYTQAAYGQNGFYDYYNKKCDTKCLTVPIPNKISGSYSSSISAAFALTLLNYSQINDMDVDKNSDILKKYDKIIILHNEYVTRKEFDAITHHPNVIYLFPNAMYAKVKADYSNNTISLIRGHGFKSPSNGFDWKYDDSKYEYDVKCNNWKFDNIPHGKMLNCYPFFKILTDRSLLVALKS